MVLFFGCKKDDEGSDGTGNIPSYILTAPACLVTRAESSDFDISNRYTYDNQKRLIHEAFLKDSEDVFYTYHDISGPTMLEDRVTHYNGITTHQYTLHQLNSAGMITQSIRHDTSSGMRYESYYTYNTSGYLTRGIFKYISSSGTSSYGSSYVYKNGNQVSSYTLNLNSNGEVIDSNLVQTTTYNVDKPGRLEAWASWIERTGRPSTNETNKITVGQYNATYSYTYGPNGFPSVVSITSDQSTSNMNLQWTCY